MDKFKLTAEETARYLSFADACRERAAGFALGMETARKMFVESLIAARKQETSKEEAPNG